MKRIILSILLTFSIIGTAQASAGLGMAPKQQPGELTRSWIVHTISPGEKVEDSVMVNNSDSSPVTVAVEALDGVNTEDGAYTLVESATDNKGVGTWIKLENSVVTIPSNSSREIKFSINVPADAPVGEQSGGIVAFVKPDDEEGRVNVKLRLGTRVYITVPGSVKRDVEIEQFYPKISGRKIALVLNAVNHSNVNIKPTIEFKLRGLLGSFTQTIDAPGIYLPNAPIRIEYDWPKRLGLFGFYTAGVAIHTNEVTEYSADKSPRQLPDQIFTAETNFWVGLRNLLWAAIVLLVGWIYIRGRKYLRDLKIYRTKTKTYVVKKGENLTDVAKHADMPPEVIASFNTIDETTKLKAGQKLQVPLGLLTSDEIFEKSESQPQPNFWRYLFLLK